MVGCSLQRGALQSGQLSTRGLATGRGTRGSCGLRFSEFFLQNIVFQTSGCRVRAPGPVGGWVGGVSSEYGCSHWDGHTDRFCCSPPCAFSAGQGDPANDSPSCASPEEKSLASSPSAGWFPSSAQRRGWLLLGNPATHPWSLGPCRARLEPHDLGPPADWLSTLLTVTYFRTCFLDRFAVSTATRSSAF